MTVKGKEITAEIPGQPTAKGEIEGNEGWINFTTDAKEGKRADSPSKSKTFEYDPKTKTIYWNGRESGNTWVKGDQKVENVEKASKDLKDN